MREKNDFIKIQGILSKGTAYKAPQNLSNQVLTAWKLKELKPQTVRPLIPFWFWGCLFIFFLLIFMVYYFSGSPIESTSRLSVMTSSMAPILDKMYSGFQDLQIIIYPSVIAIAVMIGINIHLMSSQYRKLNF
jgi:hypothetical protein